MEKRYWVLAFYTFQPIDSPEEEVRRHKEFFQGRDVTSRIYIAKNGINGQMSASVEAARAYIDWMHGDPRFAAVEFKVHFYHEQVFPRVTVKVRKQLVALDREPDLGRRGEALSSAAWREMLEEKDPDTILLDVRNDYEWAIGHFEGAELPRLTTFREFPSYAKELAKQYDPQKTRVMMYCTGGIRCEPYSALLREEGFEKVYQLQGGVIKYGLEEGHQHWKGKLFVFDDRLAVPLREGEESEVVGRCLHCGTASDVYYNCANVDCNELYLSCLACAEKTCGCCCQECQESPRRRDLVKGERPRPFRRLSEVS